MKDIIDALELTDMEKATLKALINGLYAEPGFSDVDVADLVNDTGIPVEKMRGVLSSLIKKKYIEVDSQEMPIGGCAIYLREERYGLHPEWSRY